MASGDRQRTWFPEMVEVLRADWRPEMSWAEIIALRDQLDDMLKGIRKSRNLQPVTTSTLCPCCNEPMVQGCLLYTSDAADDLLCVDLGGRRIIKKKNKKK